MNKFERNSLQKKESADKRNTKGGIGTGVPLLALCTCKKSNPERTGHNLTCPAWRSMKERNKNARVIGPEGLEATLDPTKAAGYSSLHHPPKTKKLSTKGLVAATGEPQAKSSWDGKEDRRTFKSGATRVAVKEAFHLVCPELERRVSLICAEGLESYLWKEMEDAELTTGNKGLPLSSIIKHGKRHWNKWLNGDRTEDHLAKHAWAIMAIMHAESGGTFVIEVSGVDQYWILDHTCQHAKMLVPVERRGEVQ